MSGFETAKSSIEAGHKVRFYQDYYGRQSVKIEGGWMFWRSRRIFLQNEEVLALKQILLKRRKTAEPMVAPSVTADAA